MHITATVASSPDRNHVLGHRFGAQPLGQPGTDGAGVQHGLGGGEGLAAGWGQPGGCAALQSAWRATGKPQRRTHLAACRFLLALCRPQGGPATCARGAPCNQHASPPATPTAPPDNHHQRGLGVQAVQGAHRIHRVHVGQEHQLAARGLRQARATWLPCQTTPGWHAGCCRGAQG